MKTSEISILVNVKPRAVRESRGVSLNRPLEGAGIRQPSRLFHDLRHTSLTHAAAAGNPQIYMQAQAGHSPGSITERYMHAAQILFPGAAERSKERMFGPVEQGKRAA
jgi:integrase